MLQFVTNHYKTQTLHKETVVFYHHALEYVPDYYMTQEMCKWAVDAYLSPLMHQSNCY